MTLTTTAISSRRPATLNVAIGAAAALWIALYMVNRPLWDWVWYDLAGLAPESKAGSALHFFCCDSVKIALLLSGIIFVVTILRSYMSVERTRTLLGGRREGAGNVIAASLGVATPFCSCSAVPAFVGFVAAGVPLGVTFSFLIASPMVNEVAIALLFGMFGWGPTLLYIGSGLVVAVVAGYVIGRLKMERWVEPFVFETKVRAGTFDPAKGLPWPMRVEMAVHELGTIMKKTWPYLLVGIGLGAAIHGWVPADLFARWAGGNNPFAPIVAVAIGVPLYSNAAGVLPLVESLHDKGLPMGTLLAFMMSVVALSLPELVLLRRVLKPRLIATFVGVVAIGIVGCGYLFNAVLA